MRRSAITASASRDREKSGWRLDGARTPESQAKNQVRASTLGLCRPILFRLFVSRPPRGGEIKGRTTRCRLYLSWPADASWSPHYLDPEGKGGRTDPNEQRREQGAVPNHPQATLHQEKAHRKQSGRSQIDCHVLHNHCLWINPEVEQKAN